MNRSGDSLFYPQDLQNAPPVHEGITIYIQAGLLTYGSSYSPHLPDPFSMDQWQSAAFVPDHSGGPVPDFNGVPYQAQNEHLN